MKAEERPKRRMPSLSIDMPMSVLRQKLNLEQERKIQAFRAAANRNYLNDIGKRGAYFFILSTIRSGHIPINVYARKDALSLKVQIE